MTRPGMNIENIHTGSVGGDASTIAELARMGVEPQQLELGNYYVIHTGEHVERIDLTGDQYRQAPQRKTGCVVVSDVASFAAYYKKHADADSEIYADRTGKRITAVLDAHHGAAGAARFRQHLLALQLTHSESWNAWVEKNNKPMKQSDFAEFIEDNRPDIRDPLAADLMEIVTTIQGTTKASFVGGVSLASGAKTLTWQESTDATAGGKKNLTIPAEFTLGLAVFEGATAADEVIARLRYRATSDGVHLFYKLHRPSEVVDTAFEGVITEVQSETGAPVLRGKP